MQFSTLTKYLEKLEGTSSRNEITKILSELFAKTDKSEIGQAVYLLTGKLAPQFAGVQINLADKMMVRAIAKAYSLSPGDVLALYKKKGDLGDVVFELKKAKGGEMSILAVYQSLLDIAGEAGGGSQERKLEKMARLISQLDPLSAKYIVRIPTGRLRLGFSDMTILDALSAMLVKDKSGRVPLESAFNVAADIGKIAQGAKAQGLRVAEKITPVPGVPVRPSLSERLPTAEKIMEKLGKLVAVEPKYDGVRSQVHIFEKDGKKVVSIFSRSLENTTEMFPDIVSAVGKLSVKSAIFDGEAIAYDSKNDKFLPFQETVQRKRKYEVEKFSREVPLKYFVFDILYKDGKSFLGLPFEKRRKILTSTIGSATGGVEVTKQDLVKSADEIRKLKTKYLSEGLEGVMIKKLDAVYRPGARGYHWVKFKKNTESGLSDTIDCLVMGAYQGRGKRASFGVGAFLVGVRQQGGFLTVSKIGTGLTDEQFRELARRLEKIQAVQKPEEYEVPKSLTPDIWARPSLVVEILADEISKSPLHTAHLALRFPRLVKFRDEKLAPDTTTLAELEKLYKMQAK